MSKIYIDGHKDNETVDWWAWVDEGVEASVSYRKGLHQTIRVNGFQAESGETEELIFNVSEIPHLLKALNLAYEAATGEKLDK